MKNNPVISLFSALIISAVIIIIVYVFLVLLSFNLAGGETIDQVETQHIMHLVISILLLLTAIVYGRSLIKRNKKFTAYGIFLPFLAAAIVMTVIVFQEQQPVRFDAATWQQSELKPDRMARTLIKEKKLIGLTVLQIKAMLGNSVEENVDANSEKGSVLYSLTNDWSLIVIFLNGKVVETIMRLPSLGV